MTDPAAAAIAEVVDLHRAFEAWLGAGQGEFGRFGAAFAPGFHMVHPSGRLYDRDGTLGMLRAGRAGRGAGFRIAVEEARALHAAGGLVLVGYVERQWLPAETARRATALLRVEAASVTWLHVQETWITPPPA